MASPLNEIYSRHNFLVAAARALPFGIVVGGVGGYLLVGWNPTRPFAGLYELLIVAAGIAAVMLLAAQLGKKRGKQLAATVAADQLRSGPALYKRYRDQAFAYGQITSLRLRRTLVQRLVGLGSIRFITTQAFRLGRNRISTHGGAVFLNDLNESPAVLDAVHDHICTDGENEPIWSARPHFHPAHALIRWGVIGLIPGALLGALISWSLARWLELQVPFVVAALVVISGIAAIGMMIQLFVAARTEYRFFQEHLALRRGNSWTEMLYYAHLDSVAVNEGVIEQLFELGTLKVTQANRNYLLKHQRDPHAQAERLLDLVEAARRRRLRRREASQQDEYIPIFQGMRSADSPHVEEEPYGDKTSA